MLAITGRVRSCDDVGWFERNVIGVLLPGTGAEGAYKVAGELERLLADLGVTGRWEVFTYPEHWDVVGDDHPSSGVIRTFSGGDSSSNGEAAGSHSNGHTNGEVEPQEPQEPHENGVTVGAPGSTESVPVKPKPYEAPSVEDHSTLMDRLYPRPPLWKRITDIIGASIAVLLFLPVMLVAAVAVKLSSPGPVFFRQKRVGMGGRHFFFYKFRTMSTDAEDRKKDLLSQNEQSGPVFKMTHDPRITPVGRFLRRTSIDELPQLWNVIRGDMSLVGPRPPLPEEVEMYDRWQKRRLDRMGGITCIWQVSGRSEVRFDEWVRMDIRYSRRQSFWYDLGLLARTIPAVLSGKGAR